jgi:hypothetical protein
MYILFLDNDILSFRYRKDAPGALSVFDENYLSNPFEIASTGYTIREPENLVLEVGVLADLSVRNATAKHVKRGVYFPEPCTAVKIPHLNDTVPEDFGDPKDKNYKSPNEMPQLIDKVLERRKLDPQKTMVFDSRGAIVTTLPNRMQRDFQCHSTQRNGIILWGMNDFKTMRSISQTHYNAYDWAHRMLEALSYHKQLTIGNFLLKDAKVIQDVLISLLSRLFNAFDPVELAQRMAHRKLKSGCKNRPGGALQLRLSSTVSAPRAHQVIPVAVFIMTLYNACFMFQTDKTDNFTIKALERFDLTPNIDDNAFFKTMSEYK